MDNFEQYSRRREREQEVQEKLLRDSKPEWVVLQGFTKTLADELKGIDGFRFEWVSDPSAPRLVISAVAATFLWRERPGKPIECRVRFDRKPLGSNQVWVDDRSPLEPVEWTLMPIVEGDEIKWMIAEAWGKIPAQRLS